MRRLRTNTFTIITLALSGLLLSTCALRQARENLKNCEFNLIGFEVADYSFSAVNLRFFVEIKNPNTSEVVLDRLNFEIFSEADRLAEGQHTKKVEIAPNDSDIVTIEVSSTPSALGTGLMRALLNNGSAQFTVKGTAYIDTIVGELPVPFESEYNAGPHSPAKSDK